MPTAPEISTFARATAREAVVQLIAFINSEPSTSDAVFDAQELLISSMPEPADVAHAVLMESMAAYDLFAAALATLHPTLPDESRGT